MNDVELGDGDHPHGDIRKGVLRKGIHVDNRVLLAEDNEARSIG